MLRNSHTVALLVPADWDDLHAANLYSSRLLTPLRLSLADYGLHLDICRLSESSHAQDLDDFETYLAEKKPAAFVVARVLVVDPIIDLLRNQQIPFVLFGHNSQSQEFDWVDVDNESAFWLATRKCLDAGHRKIALLNGPQVYSYAQQRENGYRRALMQAGLEFEPAHVLNGQPTYSMGAVMASYLLSGSNKPTALVCTTDEVALGAMSACRNIGLEPGKDISIVGYGDGDEAAQTSPRLATLGFSFDSVSLAIVRSLLFQLRLSDAKVSKDIRLISVYWREGESLGSLVDLSGASARSDSIGGSQLELAASYRTQEMFNVGSWRYDPATQAFECSDEFRTIFGFAPNEPISLMNVKERVSLQSLSGFDSAWLNAGLGRGLDLEVPIVSNGESRYVHWRGQFISNFGKFVYAEGAVLDVTRLAKVRRELEVSKRYVEQASAAKDQFLANMSHEIRTPIHAVMGLTEVLKRQLTDATEAQNTVEKIRRSSSSLLNIINDILLISKVNSSSFELERYPFDLQQLLDDVEASAEGLLGHKQVSFKVSPVGSTMRYLVGDPQRLKQVLINLVGNACKFTNRGQVELLVNRAPTDKAGLHTNLSFEVRDTGIGIAKQRLHTLFDSFTQADSSINRVYGGTGLGLSIAQSLVRLMGGTIEVASEPGVGSSFSFELSFDIGSANTVELNHADQLSVMIVDDSQSASLHAAEIVRQLGWLPTLFSSGQDALSELERYAQRYDLVLLDFVMPGMSGEEVAREIRNIPAAQNLAVIIVTNTDKLHLPETLSSYVDGTLEKPLSADGLLTMVSGMGLHLQTSESASSQTQLPDLTGMQVLAVDDSEINLELISDMLIQLGADVQCALNASVALELLKSSADRPFDLVLCDLQMPNIDGFEFTRRLHSLKGFEEFPVAAVSAGVDMLRRQKAADCGMAAYLEKPFTSQMLAHVVLQLVGRAEDTTPREESHLTRTSTSQLINSSQALAYWSKQGAYAKQLELFVQRYADSEFALRLVEKLDYEAILNYAHKLKGVAAVLGLEVLAERAKQLELLLRQPPTPDRGEATLRHVQKLCVLQSESVAAVRDWLSQHPSEKSTAGSSGKVTLAQLHAALVDFDPVAVEVCLQSEINELSLDLRQQLLEAVSDFDFKAALRLLETAEEQSRPMH